MKASIVPSSKKIKAKLAYVRTIPISCIVVHHNNGTIPYRNDGLRTARTKDDFLDFMFNSSILGRNITKIKFEEYFKEDYINKEWAVWMDVSNEMSETSNITPEIIELLYHSFSSKNGKYLYGNHIGQGT